MEQNVVATHAADSAASEYKRKTRIASALRWCLLTGCIIPIVYCLLLIGNPNDLEGIFSSYDLFPHDKRDVIQFENGLVTLKTCCGNNYYGSYMRKPDDSWIWKHQAVVRMDPPEFQFKKPMIIQVEPHWFSITLRFDNGDKMTLPRRVFSMLPL